MAPRSRTRSFSGVVHSPISSQPATPSIRRRKRSERTASPARSTAAARRWTKSCEMRERPRQRLGYCCAGAITFAMKTSSSRAGPSC